MFGALGWQRSRHPFSDRSVVLVALRLGRLLLSRLLLGGLAAPLPAGAAAPGGHAFAAVHPAVAIPVCAAAHLHGMTLVLVMLPTVLLALRHLVAGMGSTPLLPVLRMVLVLLCRMRRLGGGGHGERKSDRGDKNLHLKVS